VPWPRWESRQASESRRSSRRSSREGCTEEEALFGEAPGGILVAAPADAIERLESRASGVAVSRIGRAGGQEMAITAGKTGVSVALGEAEAAWRSLGGRLGA